MMTEENTGLPWVFYEGADYSRSQLSDLESFPDNFFSDLEEIEISDVKNSGKKRNIFQKGQFNFVGLMVTHSTSFVVLPKYLKEERDRDREPQRLSKTNDNTVKWKQAQRIVDTCRKYGKSKANEYLTYSPTSDTDSRLSNWLWLLDDYRENGPYNAMRHRPKRNGNGAINWARTIERIEPLWVKQNGTYAPLYSEWFDSKRREDEAHLVRRIHLAVLSEIEKMLSDNGLAELLRLPPLDCAPEELSHIGTHEYLKQVVRRQLNIDFSTHGKRLLHALLDYLDSERKNKRDRDKPLYVGTPAFAYVWEKALQTILGHDKSAIEKIAKPQWTVLNSEIELDEEGEFETSTGETARDTATLKPDIVVYSGDKMHIFDAKYYLPNWDDKTLTGQPGVGDLIKQFMYEVALEDYRKEKEKTFGLNAFLMPMTCQQSKETTEKVFSQAKTHILFIEKLKLEGKEENEGKLEPILTFLLNPDDVLDAYLGKSKTDFLHEIENKEPEKHALNNV